MYSCTKRPQLQIKIADLDDLKASTATPSPSASNAGFSTPVVTSLMQRVTRDFDFWRYFVNEGNVNSVMAGNWKTVVTIEEARQILAYFRGTALDAIAKTDVGVSHLVGRTLYELREFFCGILDCGEISYKVLRELSVGSMEGSEKRISLKMQKERLTAFMSEMTPRMRPWMTPLALTRSFIAHSPMASECGFELDATSSLMQPTHESVDSDECKMSAPSPLRAASSIPFDDGLLSFTCGFRGLMSLPSPRQLASFEEEEHLEVDSVHESDALVADESDTDKSKELLRVFVTFDDSEERKSEIETDDELEFYDGHCSHITTRSAMSTVTRSTMRHSIVSSLTFSSEKAILQRLALAMHAPF